MMGYTEQDINEMSEAIGYALQGATEQQEEEQIKWLGEALDLLNGILVEGRI